METDTNTTLREARIRRVEEHIHSENAHDLEAVMETFSENPRYDDEPWGEHHMGWEAVRGFYERLFEVAPDLSVEVLKRYVTGEAVIIECEISGTQLGWWRGLPPTGRHVRFSLCSVYTFEEGDKLAGERIYYDRATVLGQLGVLHDPESLPGRLATVLTHPVTLARALLRQVVGRWSRRNRSLR